MSYIPTKCSIFELIFFPTNKLIVDIIDPCNSRPRNLILTNLKKIHRNIKLINTISYDLRKQNKKKNKKHNNYTEKIIWQNFKSHVASVCLIR